MRERRTCKALMRARQRFALSRSLASLGLERRRAIVFARKTFDGFERLEVVDDDELHLAAVGRAKNLTRRVQKCLIGVRIFQCRPAAPMSCDHSILLTVGNRRTSSRSSNSMIGVVSSANPG